MRLMHVFRWLLVSISFVTTKSSALSLIIALLGTELYYDGARLYDGDTLKCLGIVDGATLTDGKWIHTFNKEKQIS